MGYKKIYLLGADQDLYLKDSYCTEIQKYYQKKILKKKNRYQMIATCNNFISSWSTYRLMQSHYSLSNYCKTNNVSIINLSQGGILDMYKNGELKTIIK
tara:strand:+ start:277 stop:573 length:297 start_codon:yes stop_codon:yes gene_type:complete